MVSSELDEKTSHIIAGSVRTADNKNLPYNNPMPTAADGASATATGLGVTAVYTLCKFGMGYLRSQDSGWKNFIEQGTDPICAGVSAALGYLTRKTADHYFKNPHTILREAANSAVEPLAEPAVECAAKKAVERLATDTIVKSTAAEAVKPFVAQAVKDAADEAVNSLPENYVLEISKARYGANGGAFEEERCTKALSDICNGKRQCPFRVENAILGRTFKDGRWTYVDPVPRTPKELTIEYRCLDRSRTVRREYVSPTPYPEWSPVFLECTGDYGLKRITQ